jgi:hypothetical protein
MHRHLQAPRSKTNPRHALTRLGITPQHCPAYSPGEAIPAIVRCCAVRLGSTPQHCATHSHTAGTPRPRKEMAEPLKGDERRFRARTGPCRDVGHAPAVTVGGIRNQAFRAPKTKECLSRPDSYTKDPEAKSLKPLNLSSSFRSRFSA